MPALGRRAAQALRGLRREEAAAECARLRRSAALLAARDGGARRRQARERALRPRAGGRVPGHECAPGRHPAEPAARRRGTYGGGRRRPVHLLLPRRHGAEHPRLPRLLRPAGQRRHPRAQLPFDPAHPRRLQRRDRAGEPALLEASLLAPAFAAEARPRHRRGRERPGRVRGGAHPRAPRGGGRPQAAGGADPHLPPQRSSRAGAGPPQHPLREVRRPQVPRGRPREGSARRAALGREPPRRHGGLPRASAPGGSGPRPRPASPRPSRERPLRAGGAGGLPPARRRRRGLARPV